MILNAGIECANEIVDTYEKVSKLHKEASAHFIDIREFLYKEYQSSKTFWFKKSKKNFFNFYFGVKNPKMGDFWSCNRLREWCNQIDNTGILYKQISAMYYTMYALELSRIEILITQIKRYSQFETNSLTLEDDEIEKIERLYVTQGFLNKIIEMKPKIMEIIGETLNMDENGSTDSR